MKTKGMWIVELSLVLVGCGGESFSDSLFDPGADGAPGGSAGTGGETSTGGESHGTGGAAQETGGSQATGGVAPTGGTTSTGGALATGGSSSSTGGAPGTGGTTSTGGATGTGGSTCTLVTHSDGLGQTWQDCVALGTYDVTEAQKACQTWCAANGGCGCTESVGPNSSCPDAYWIAPKTTTSSLAWAISSGTVMSVSNTPTCTPVGTWN